jgi:hypothetical protein
LILIFQNLNDKYGNAAIKDYWDIILHSLLSWILNKYSLLVITSLVKGHERTCIVRQECANIDRFGIVCCIY